jgi:hypothetical protein
MQQVLSFCFRNHMDFINNIFTEKKITTATEIKTWNSIVHHCMLI